MPHGADTYTFTSLPAYPHLRPADAAIWDEYVRKNPADFIRCWYDVRIGEPEAIEGDVEPRVARDWYDLNRWQIDVVAEDAHAIYVIEVKPNARAGAIGQALAYAVLLAEKWKPTKPIVPAVCTDRISKITAEVAKLHGVEIWIP